MSTQTHLQPEKTMQHLFKTVREKYERVDIKFDVDIFILYQRENQYSFYYISRTRKSVKMRRLQTPTFLFIKIERERERKRRKKEKDEK